MTFWDCITKKVESVYFHFWLPKLEWLKQQATNSCTVWGNVVRLVLYCWNYSPCRYLTHAKCPRRYPPVLRFLTMPFVTLRDHLSQLVCDHWAKCGWCDVINRPARGLNRQQTCDGRCDREGWVEVGDRRAMVYSGNVDVIMSYGFNFLFMISWTPLLTTKFVLKYSAER